MPRGRSLGVAGMLAGARAHLEAGHAQYLLDVIHSHPAQAALGGSPGRLPRVHAFLRVRLRGQGDLDFDRHAAGARPGIDTTWQQVRRREAPPGSVSCQGWRTASWRAIDCGRVARSPTSIPKPG